MAEESEDTESAEAYQELTEYVVGSLIDDGVDFRVEIDEHDDQVTLNVYVPSEHRGQVIGRGGRIARSMRTVLDCAGIEDTRSISLDIVD